MVHSAILRVFLNLEVSLSTVGTDGRDCESPYLLLVFLNRRSIGEGLRKRKGVRYPHGRRPQLVNYTVNKSS